MIKIFRLAVLAFIILSINSCRKDKNQTKTIRIENLSWMKVHDGLSLNVLAIGAELYLTKQNQLWKSTDMGNNWTKLGWPMDVNIVGGMAFSSKNNQLVIGAANNGWYNSGDKGMVFQASGPSAFNTGSADILALSNGQLIATQGGSLRGLYKSNGNLPLTWRQTFGSVDFTSIAKISEDTIYACGIGAPAIVRSFDGGENWVNVENKAHALNYITAFEDSILVVHRWGTISVANRKNGIDLYAVRSTIAGNMVHFGDYSSNEKLLMITAVENGIFLSRDMAISFKYYPIEGVKAYFHPKIIGDYLFVNTDAGLYRAQFKF